MRTFLEWEQFGKYTFGYTDHEAEIYAEKKVSENEGRERPKAFYRGWDELDEGACVWWDE